MERRINVETLDVTKSAKRIIKYGLVGLVALSTAIGGAAYNYQHRNDTIQLNNAKVNGTMVSVRVLTNGKIKELTKSDGDEVKAGEVIAKIEASVTEEQIEQLEKVLDLAKQNYAKLEVGQMVKVAVQKPKVKTVQVPTPSSQRPQRSTVRSNRNAPATVEALEERKNRMELLYEMGAISRKQLEEARREYAAAKAAGTSSTTTPSTNLVPQFSTTTEIEYETEYVDQLQPTPPEVLKAAQLAIKQAELSLNVAKQEAQQTEIVAPVNGTIFYGVEVDEEVKAGDVISRIGDNNELWVESEVTEDQFNKIPLGKLVSYVINGNKVTGTVIDKIAPSDEEENKEPEEKPLENFEPTPESAPADTPNTPQENTQTSMLLNKYNGVGGPEPENNSETPAENNSAQPATENQSEEKAADSAQSTEQPSAESEEPEKKDKYIIKFSLPVDRNFECKPNMAVTVMIRDIR